MAFRWRANDGPTLNADLVCSFVIFQGIRISIAKKPYIFLIFHGGGLGGPPPPLDPRMWSINTTLIKTFSNNGCASHSLSLDYFPVTDLRGFMTITRNEKLMMIPGSVTHAALRRHDTFPVTCMLLQVRLSMH